MKDVIVRFVAAAAVATVLWVTPNPAQAQWTGKGEAGLIIANGNTDTRNGNAKLELATTRGSWKHAVGLAGIYAQADDLTTGQRWEAYEQTDYNFSPRNFWFGSGRYEDDRFSGFQYQATLATGLGRHFVENDRTKLTGSAGAGYKFFETRDVFDPVSGVLLTPAESDSEAVFRGLLDFSHVLTDTTKVLNKLLVEAGSNNTFIQNDLALQVKISNVLALAAGYSVRRNSDPPLGFRKTDTLTTLNLVYEIR
ncbi:MAG: DUF481 domain-containing protein [Gammaproteobacteria bacterium]